MNNSGILFTIPYYSHLPMPSTKFVRKGFSFIFSTRCHVETDTIENPLMKSAPILAVLHYLHVTHAFLLFSQYTSKIL